MAEEPNVPDSKKKGSASRLSTPARAGASVRSTPSRATPSRATPPRATPPRTRTSRPSRPVIVETKRKRALKAATKTLAGVPAIKTTKPAIKPEEPLKETKPEIKSARTTASAAAKKKKEQKEPSPGGVILRPLTAREKKNRATALTQIKQKEKEDRAQAEEKARIAQEENAKRKQEEEQARKHAETLRDQRQQEQQARTRAEIETAQRPEVIQETEKKRTLQRRPTERQRRQSKLTISNALDDSERQQSLSALRRRRQRARPTPEKTEKQRVVRDVVIPETISVVELASRMALRVNEVIKFLMRQDIIAKADDTLDADTAQLVAEEFGHRIKRITEADVEEAIDATKDLKKDLRPRPPVVTVMGHVDHGKTSLLDALRNKSTAAGEAGGITQHIGAYQVATPAGKKITFIDTPGHAAFTSMRARGAKTTDIVILVIAADDGVMPQTIESINHAKAAKTPIIVALNKIDLPGAEPQKIMQELLQYEIVGEDHGGDVLCVEMSAKTGKGIDALMEAIFLQTDILELKANPARAAQGVILEARLDKGAGHVATVLVQRGTLRLGDVFVAGAHTGRVRSMKSDDGQNLKHALPSTPVWVSGLSAAVQAGDPFDCVEDETRAREIAEYRQRKNIAARSASSAPLSMEQIFAAKDQKPELALIVKTDVQGSADAVVTAVQGLGGEEIDVKIVHAGVGEVSMSDVTLAETTGAAIFMFNVKANAEAQKAAREAKLEKVEMRAFEVIYDLIDAIKEKIALQLGPERRETILGQAEILQLFGVGKKNIAAGCRVGEGQIRKEAHLRIRREDVIIYDGAIESLRRFKDNVAIVEAGQECGITFDNPPELKQGDQIESVLVEQIERRIN